MFVLETERATLAEMKAKARSDGEDLSHCVSRCIILLMLSSQLRGRGPGAEKGGFMGGGS